MTVLNVHDKYLFHIASSLVVSQFHGITLFE